MDYKQKLRLAKEAIESGSYDRETIEYIFPELKESKDKRIRKGLIKGLSAMRDIHHHQIFSDDAINIDDAIDWLKSLKPRWKPTENQMSMLLAVIHDGNNANSESCHNVLQSLYNDLKNFRIIKN